MLAGFSARAHDPYEITATASVLPNRFEITAIYEYRAARLLAGLGWPTNQINEAEEFSTMKPALEKVAATFFQVAADGKKLRPISATAQLGVENHVTFTVGFPAVGTQPLVMSAPGLAALAPEGQYGVGLTVLDMVRKKVLGQHVFSAANPLATASFAPPAEAIAAVQKTNAATAKIELPSEPAKSISIQPSKLATPTAKKNPPLWPWFIAAAIGLAVAWRMRR